MMRDVEGQGPFLHLKMAGNTIDVAGSTSYAAGHKLPHRTDGTPDGIFVEWSWDGLRLQVRNDRYGARPCFYFAGPGEICVSPSIPQLLAQGAPLEFDDGGMAVFLRLGHFVGEDTPFKAIRALPPAATLEWADGHLGLSGGFAVAREQQRGREDAIDGYIALFRKAVRRRLLADGNFAIPLSGGRDSRHILFELVTAGYLPRLCVTARYFPERPSQEVEIAAHLAQAVGVPHVLLSQPHSRLAAEIRKNLRTSFCALDHAWALPVADYLDGMVDVIYDGLGGDVLSGGGTLRPERLALYAAGRFVEFCDKRFTISEERLRGLLTPCLYRRWSRERALDRIIPELRRHAEAANPLGSFHFWNKGRRGLALLPCGIHGHLRTVFCPYLDHDLYDLLASLPAAMLADRTFHTETVRRAFPQYADIPFEDRDVLAPRNPALVRQFAREFGAYILGQGRSGIVRPQFLFPRLVRHVLDGSVNRFGPSYWFAIYLLQLERLTRALGRS